MDVTESPPEPALPFDSVFDSYHNGPRISSCHSQPKTYYGPVTIRNYITGSTLRQLRTAKFDRNVELKRVFLRLPIELKLMVLEHLHPLDLYNFSQVSRYFRTIIMSPKASGVWKTAFQRNPGHPQPPPGVTWLQWAFMLFGPGICSLCGKYGALTDFAFRNRYCEPCMKLNYAYLNNLSDTTGHTLPHDHVVFSLIPRSYRYHGLRYTTSYATAANARYLRNDFQAMMKKVTLIQLLIDREVPTIAELFDEYKTALKSHVDKIVECADKANLWAMDVFRACSIEYDNRIRENTERCKKRLENLGHENQDILSVGPTISNTLHQEAVWKLTPRAFRKIRPKMESVVTQRKIRRLKTERQTLLEGIYDDYQKTLDPDRWQYLPPKRLVKDIEGFSDFLNAKYDKRGDLEPGHAVTLFPAFIADWTKQQQADILKLMQSPGGEHDSEALLKKMELAKYVFSCGDCKFKYHDSRALVGWNNICRHKRQIIGGYASPCGKYELNSSASAASASLIFCAGLNPAEATVSDMDSRDGRFMCGNCTSQTTGFISGLKVYTWMECLYHFVDMQIDNNVMHSSPAWILLTPEATRFVKEHEYPHPLPHREAWRCNKCATHFSAPVTQSDAIQHVEKVHLVQHPVIGVDVAHDKRFHTRRRKPFRLGLEPAYELRCSHCPERPIYKLWELQRLAIHIRLKHGIAEPVENQDWAKVVVIGTTTGPLPDPEPEPEPEAQQTNP